MNKENTKRTSKFVKLIIYVVALCTLIAIARFTNTISSFNDFFAMKTLSVKVLIQLLSMIFLVLLIENIVQLILPLFNVKSHRGRTVISLTCSLIKYVTAIVILCCGLSIIGVNVATIVASVGILALIVGFGAESLIEDVITGIFMLFENQYNVGDIIEVNGFRGTVSDIGIRTTSIKDASDNIKIINNSEMKSILNRSNNTSKAICDIAIPYETKLEDFEKNLDEILSEIQKKHEDTFLECPTYIGVQELQDSGILLRFGAVVSEKNLFNAVRILNHDLLISFQKIGVNCPYPQLDVRNK